MSIQVLVVDDEPTLCSLMNAILKHGGYRVVSVADGQEGVSAANDGLVGVIGIEVEATPREDARKNVSRSGDTLTGFTADPDCKINFGHGFSRFDFNWLESFGGVAGGTAAPGN